MAKTIEKSIKIKTLKLHLSILVAFSLVLSSCYYKENISPVNKENNTPWKPKEIKIPKKRKRVTRTWDKEHGWG